MYLLSWSATSTDVCLQKSQDLKRPFDTEIIAAIIAKFYFDGPKSVAAQNRERFTSSVREKPHELEIPEAMLGMACAAVGTGAFENEETVLTFLPQIGLALGDWESGTFTQARDFNIGDAEVLYSAAINEMHRIRKQSPVMYHRVMHKVYTNVL